MFAVVQFIENNKFQVLAVPVSWIKGGILLWPKLSNEKIEGLRVSGAEYYGAAKRIPVIIWKKFRKFDAAEKAADDLALKDVSDVEGKRKKLKTQKKPALEKSKDYNALFEALPQPSNKGQPRSAEPRTNNLPSSDKRIQLPKNPGGENKVTEHSMAVEKVLLSQLEMTHSPIPHSQSNQAQTEQIQILAATPSLTMPPPPTAPCQFQSKPIFNQPQMPQPTPVVTESSTIVGTRILQQQKHANCDSNVNDSVSVVGVHGSLMPLPQPHFSGAEGNAIVIEGVHEPQQPGPIYCTTDDIYFLPEAVTGRVNLENHLITDNSGSIKYEDLKNDLKHYIRTTMEEVVQKCFHEHFSRLTALSQMNTKTTTTAITSAEDDSVENHNRIDNEVQLHDWNVKLANEDLCGKYLVYFTRIIPPNSYANNGDNACYTIVDCLFTRDFWTRFTWTGISRGQKSKRGFREFGNVLKLLEDLVCIGDPTYSAKKLEDFCRTRLFRYSKSRSSNKQLRKSACRPARKRKADKVTDDQELCKIKNEAPIELVDDAQIDSDEESEQGFQDESIDVADEADEEPEDDDENTGIDELSD